MQPRSRFLVAVVLTAAAVVGSAGAASAKVYKRGYTTVERGHGPRGDYMVRSYHWRKTWIRHRNGRPVATSVRGYRQRVMRNHRTTRVWQRTRRHTYRP